MVVGAGPAGLLFVIVGRLLAQKTGLADAWSLRLVDKRNQYARTHRLRMDPAPYLAIQRDVDDPRFDALVALLDEHAYQPEVNALEEALASLARSLGVEKEKRAIEDAAGLRALRDETVGEGLVTIVGADSVHSVVRESVQGDRAPRHVTHERLARLRVRGDALPAKLGLVDRVRISKVLGSIVDYRLNRNGYAEVDLFLTEAEHRAVRDVGATPKTPVPITSRAISSVRAPLFRAIVQHLEEGLGATHAVEVQSTFELEHTISERLVFEPSELRATVFLVGDAGVSLPFFRGMACLASCAHALARVHVDLLVGQGDRQDVARRYDREASEIVRHELAIVSARARLVRGAREAFRVAAMLPFPIQTWLLRAREPHPERDRATPGLFINAAIALVAASLVLAGSSLEATSDPAYATWLLASAFPVELAGGAAYRGALALEAPPHRWVARVWTLQILALFVVGVGLALPIFTREGWLAALLALTWWFSLAVAFAVGMLGFERIVGRELTQASLDEHQP